jgi:hypothetical protein
MDTIKGHTNPRSKSDRLPVTYERGFIFELKDDLSKVKLLSCIGRFNAFVT